MLLGATPASSVVGGQRGMFPIGPAPLREFVKMRRRILAPAARMKVGATLEPPWSWAKLQGPAPTTLSTFVFSFWPASHTTAPVES